MHQNTEHSIKMLQIMQKYHVTCHDKTDIKTFIPKSSGNNRNLLYGEVCNNMSKWNAI